MIEVTIGHLTIINVGHGLLESIDLSDYILKLHILHLVRVVVLLMNRLPRHLGHIGISWVSHVAWVVTQVHHWK